MRFGLRGHATTFVFALVVHAASAGFANAQGPSAEPLSAPPKVLMTPFFAIGGDVTPGAGGAFTLRARPFGSDVAEVFGVLDGKIASFDIYFDSSPFPK
jgi:hypothetical protein